MNVMPSGTELKVAHLAEMKFQNSCNKETCALCSSTKRFRHLCVFKGIVLRILRVETGDTDPSRFFRIRIRLDR